MNDKTSYLVGHDFLSPRFRRLVVRVQDVSDRPSKARLEDDARQRQHRQLRAVPRRKSADVDVRVGREVSELDLVDERIGWKRG